MSDTKKINVAVLMSTYNGEKYVKDQVRSILRQDVPNNIAIKIYVRDDGSADATVSILEKMSAKSKNISIISSTLGNVGVKKSFFSLVSAKEIEADFFFLSDQDDIWEPDKVALFLNEFFHTPTDIPVGVFSDLWIADKNAVSTKKKMSDVGHWGQNVVNYPFLSFDYRVTGAAFAFNKAARNTFTDVISSDIINKVNMHDSFFALLVATVGKLIQLDIPTVRYRQHGNNVIGATKKKRSITTRINQAVSVPGQLIRDNVLLGDILEKSAFHVDLSDKTLISKYRDYYDAKGIGKRTSSALKIYPVMHHRRRILHLLLMCGIHVTDFVDKPWLGNSV